MEYRYLIKAVNNTNQAVIYTDKFVLVGKNLDLIVSDDLASFIFEYGNLADPLVRSHYFNYPDYHDIDIHWIKNDRDEIIYSEIY